MRLSPHFSLEELTHSDIATRLDIDNTPTVEIIDNLTFLAGELEKLTKEIESGQAPFDQQQKLQIDFMQKRIEHLEETHEKIRNDIMDLIHQIGNIPQMTNNNGGHGGH